jgi:hypothetical protein
MGMLSDIEISPTMTTQNNTTGTIPVTTATDVRTPSYRNLSWRAIIAGTVAGLAIHLLLTTLGLGLGIGALEPITDENPVSKLGIGAGIAWCVSALIALFGGGWVAGRFAPSDYKLSGTIHGFLVWSLATVAMFVFTTTGAGVAIGGAAQLLGMAAKPVAAATSGVTDIAKDAIKQNTDAIGSYVDEAIQSAGQNLNPGAAVRARREIGYALTKLFTSGGDIQNPENRGAVTRALTQAGISEDQANRMLTEWSGSMQQMKTDLDQAKNTVEQKARETGEKASSAVSKAALWTALAFLIGAIVASLGGKAGADVVDDEPRRRVVA